MKDFKNFNLIQYNTFGINASCRRFVEFDNDKEVTPFLCTLNEDDMPLLIIGAGSNLLLTKDFEGTVLHSAIKGVESRCDNGFVYLTCGSGEIWDDIVELCIDHGWHGAENLSLIPGDVGATAVQNIGAYGVEVKDFIWSIEAIEVATGLRVVIPRSECEYAYRDSRFKHDWKNQFFITSVTYRFSETFSPMLEYGNIKQRLKAKGVEKPTARQLRDAIIDIRNEKLPDPKVMGNAGSFFVNPVVEREKYLRLMEEFPDIPHYYVDENHEKIPAAWLIDKCGWKGRSLGNAGVHDKQALVLVNKGGASGEEVLRLCEAIREDVLGKFGIKIYTEVNII
ncbi:MAG: UDP-N-acetylmuramate dehydrogenase [Prevotella sp.]|nr:UDP-N-acetylmuramate dehydrogenase [Prevotella sp.]